MKRGFAGFQDSAHHVHLSIVEVGHEHHGQCTVVLNGDPRVAVDLHCSEG